MSAAKKNFSEGMDNPAMQFFSVSKQEAPQQELSAPAPAPEKRGKTITIPEGMKINQALIEKRSGRMQLLVQPSLIQKVKEKAREKGCSMNDYVHSLLEQAVEGSN